MSSTSASLHSAPINDRRWNLAALLLLQNVAHEISGDSVLKLLADVLSHLFFEGGIILAWRKNRQMGGFVMTRVGAAQGDEHRRLRSHSAESDLLRAPPNLPPYHGQTEVIPYSRKRWSGLYFRGSQPKVEGWLLAFTNTVNCNAILDNVQVRDGVLAAIERFQKLMAIGVARHRELDALVDSLYMTKERDVQSRLQSSCDLLQRLTGEPDDCLDLAARLGRLILNDLIDSVHATLRLTQVRTALQIIYDAWHSNWHTPGDAADRVRCLLHCFAALQGQDRGRLPLIGDEVMAVLPSWIEQHLRWSASKRKDTKKEWHLVVGQTLPMLGKWLAVDSERRNQSSAQQTPLRHLPSVRNTLSLWLCLKILKSCPDPESEQRRLLAYELRECLRFIAFGDRKENLSHLSWMVATHATQYIPYCDVRSFMQALGKIRGINHYSALDHLRHALDIYVTGHYFLDMQLVRPDGHQSVAEVLFGSTAAAVQDGKAAFSLAALFHDVDMVFLPDRTHIGERFVATMTGGGRVSVPEELQSAAGMIDALIGTSCPAPQAATIVADLEAVLASGPDGASGAQEAVGVDKGLHDWLAKQRSGGLEHGTLSAWFLTRICRRAEACKPRALRQAVKAVLLHEAHDVKVSLAADPMAGLLVLLNEIFVWDPRWFGAEALDRWINPANVRLTWDPEQGLVTRLEVRPDQTWPLIRIALRPDLSLRIWQICLRKARNLGRLIPMEAAGFSPEVEVISTIPEVLRSQGYKTHELLTDVLLSQVPDLGGGQTALREWLKAVPTHPSDPRLVHESEETMTLRALGDRHHSLQSIPVDLLNQLQDEWEGRVSAPPRQDELGPGPSPRVVFDPKLAVPSPPTLLNGQHTRALLNLILKTDSHWQAFVLDSFPEVQRDFTQGMDRTAQTNLLLASEDHARILDELLKHLSSTTDDTA